MPKQIELKQRASGSPSTETQIKNEPKWLAIEVEGGVITPAQVALLDGAAFAIDHGTEPKALGRLERDGDHLVLAYANGSRHVLTASKGRSLLVQLSGKYATRQMSERTRDQLVAIAARCPAWAQLTVLKHLLPAEVAAFEKKHKDARIAQLQRAGAISQGKEPRDKVEIHGTASSAQEARKAQLRGIAKLATARH